MSYEELMNSPWEAIEWLYNKHIQQLVDMEKERNAQGQLNRFI